MKCYIAVVCKVRCGAYPDKSAMMGLGHNLVCLQEEICRKYYGGVHRPLVQEELTFIREDQVLKHCMATLSLFGQRGRYYNLDVVAGQSPSVMDPEREWKELESMVEDHDLRPVREGLEHLHREYYPRVNSKLIARMERLVRAIAFQFTLGDHGGEVKLLAGVYDEFRKLRDDEFGTREYRRSVAILRRNYRQWIKRSDEEIASSVWPSVPVERADFGDDWPFRVDRVIVQRQEEHFFIVNIGGFDFGLNGAAQKRFGLLDPHDAGMAVLGRSLGPFITMAGELSK